MVLLLILCLSLAGTCAASTMEHKATALEKAAAFFTPIVRDEVAEEAQLQFSRLMAQVSRQFDKTSPYHTDVAYAQFYFNYLFNTGSEATRQSLSAIAYKLEVLLRKELWSTEKKALLIHAFLQTAFSQLEHTVPSKKEQENIQKLYRHLLTCITPTIIGVSEKVKRLPYGKIALALAAAKGAHYVHKNWQPIKDNTAKSFKILGHVNDNLAENQRAKEAFKAIIAKDKNGKLIDDHDPVRNRQVFRLATLINPDNIKDPRNWIPEPEGFGDRAVRLGEGLLETARPLMPQLIENMSASADQQRAWFAAHDIPTDNPQSRFVRVQIASDPNALESYEMRYAAQTSYSGALPSASSMITHKLWKDPRTGAVYPTYLPPRNMMEQSIMTANNMVDLIREPVVTKFLGTMTHEFERNARETMNWLRSEGLLDKHATRPTDLAEGVEVIWDADRKTFCYKKGAITVPTPPSMIDKIFGTVSLLTKEGGAGQHLLESISNKLNSSAKALNEWLLSQGLIESLENPRLKEGVRVMTDENKHEYYVKHMNAQITDKDKLYPPVSAAEHLFYALGRLSKQENMPLAEVIDALTKTLEGVALDFKESTPLLWMTDAQKKIVKKHREEQAQRHDVGPAEPSLLGRLKNRLSKKKTTPSDHESVTSSTGSVA
ncbi:MAG: hypothetical protein QG604_554 [Candidatus Dependentiae bacterium]|nr:hypothetical protein [Candidatus Dependentiae bacterium]